MCACAPWLLLPPLLATRGRSPLHRAVRGRPLRPQVMRIIAGEGLSDANMLKAFEQCGQDGTGNIDYQEFLAGQTELKKWKQKRKPKKK